MEQLSRSKAFAQINFIGPIVGIVFVLIAMFFTSYPIAISNDKDINGDRRQYLELAKNLATRGEFAMRVRQETPETAFWRPPAYPAFLGICMSLTGELEVTDEQLTQGELPNTKHLYFCLQLMLALTTAFSLWLIVESRWLAVLCFALVACNPLLALQCSRFLSELFSAFWLAVVSLLLLQVTKKYSIKYSAATGICCGLLCLSRPTFLYFAPLAGLWLFFLPRLTTQDQEKRNRITAVFLLSFTLIVMPWMMRNYSLCGRFLISDRGGFNLYLRGLHDTMNSTEFKASFFAWSGLKIARKTLKKRFREKDYRRILKSKENSFLAQAKERAFSLYQPEKDFAPKRAAQADYRLTQEGLKLILSHPFRHVAISLPVAMRSTYVMRGLLGPVIFGSLCLLFLFSIYRKEWPLLAVIFPSVFAFVFHSFLTTGVPRYSLPLVPIATLAFLIGTSKIAGSVRRKLVSSGGGQSHLGSKLPNQ